MAKKVFAALGRALCYTLLFIGMQFIVSFAVVLIGGAGMIAQYVYDNSFPDITALVDQLSAYIYNKAMLITLVSDVLALVFLWIFFAARKKNILAEVHVARGVPGLAYIPLAVGGACLAGLVGTVLSMLPIPESVWEEYGAQSSMIGGSGIMAVLASVIIAPLTEEVFFRGIVYTRLRRAMPPVVAMILSSLVFGLLHGQLIWVCYAFVMGMALCAVFERTGSIRASFTVHLAFNAVGGYLLDSVEAGALAAVIFACVTAASWIWLGRICPYTKLHPEDI